MFGWLCLVVLFCLIYLVVSVMLSISCLLTLFWLSLRFDCLFLDVSACLVVDCLCACLCLFVSSDSGLFLVGPALFVWLSMFGCLCLDVCLIIFVLLSLFYYFYFVVYVVNLICLIIFVW